MRKAFFVSATDTDAGKTIAVLSIAALLQKKGLDVGIMKPVQCGGSDAAFLKKRLGITDPLATINPYYAPEPLSPHVAFKRAKRRVDIPRIIRTFSELKKKHDVVIVEGAGGLFVPITEKYLMSDLIRDLDVGVVIVSRLALGTINHTLLTVNQARECGIEVIGVVFNTLTAHWPGVPEKTNPAAIKHIGRVPVLGTIPYLRKKTAQEAVKKCSGLIAVKKLLQTAAVAHRTRQKLTAWDKQFLWHPFTQMQDWLTEEPLIISRGKGCCLEDMRGRRYLDGVSSLWVNVHGHRHKTIDAAIKSQVNRISHSTMLGLSNEPAIQLAKQLVNVAPRGLRKVFYSDNGSTAVEVGIKIAYQYWQNIGKRKKRKIVHLAHSYHGDTLGSVSVGGIGLFHKVYRNLTFATMAVDAPYCYRCPVGKTYPRCNYACLKKLRDTLRRLHSSIAAFVVEPLVQGAAGMLVWPSGILKRMKRLCEQYNVLFIADEVATGFGRTGEMFACTHEKVAPDILCLAKGMTGGYLPLAATLTTKKVFDGFLFDYRDQKTFFHGHTYTGNPVCCAAALGNLAVFKKERTLRALKPKIKFLRNKLRALYNLSHVGDIRQKGFMAGIELVKNKKTKEPYPWQEKIGVAVCQQARAAGVILRPLGNVIVLMPPLAITRQELARLVDITYRAIEKVTGS